LTFFKNVFPVLVKTVKPFHDKGRRIFTHNQIFCQFWPHPFVLDVFSWCFSNVCSISLAHLGPNIGQVTGFAASNISVSPEVNAYKSNGHRFHRIWGPMEDLAGKRSGLISMSLTAWQL